jgi:hypothetical protein
MKQLFYLARYLAKYDILMANITNMCDYLLEQSYSYKKLSNLKIPCNIENSIVDYSYKKTVETTYCKYTFRSPIKIKTDNFTIQKIRTFGSQIPRKLS